LLPGVLFWGTDLGPVDETALAELARVSVPPPVGSQVDVPVPVSLLAEQSAGWLGTPGLTGHRAGRDFSTAFTIRSLEHLEAPEAGVAHRLTAQAADDGAGLGVAVIVELLATGLLRMRGEVTNHGSEVFDLTSLDLTLPVPTEATEILDLTGRWLRERAPQRRDFTLGTHLRESRRARGLDASLVMAAGRAGFGWRSGELRAVHVAWSGNTRTYAERDNSGTGRLGGGELLLAGEIRLAEGESYAAPWVYATHGEGLDEAAGRFHDYLRARPTHPAGPRPVTLNVWEAVYF